MKQITGSMGKSIKQSLKPSVTQTARKILKRSVLAVLLCCMIASLSALPAHAAAKNYWLTGVSKPAGGKLRMYYKEDAISIKGSSRRASSEANVYDAKEKKRSCSLKVSGKCKVILVEAENVQTLSYQDWAKNQDYQNGSEISFISATLKIKNNKIVKIYFSA